MRAQHRASSSTKELRLLLGVFVQPFVAGGLAFLVSPLLLLDSSGQTLAGGFPANVADMARSVAVGAGLVALAVAMVGVLPLSLWLTNRRRVSLAEALLWGLALGNCPFVLGTLFAGSYGIEGIVRGLAFSSLLGVAGAAAFWAIAMRGFDAARQG